MTVITRHEVLDVLERWRSGQLAEAQVHAWAEARYAASAYEPESEACSSVLAELDMMDMNLLTATDAPILIEALCSADHEAVLARLAGQIDIPARQAALRDNPFYARFCK